MDGDRRGIISGFINAQPKSPIFTVMDKTHHSVISELRRFSQIITRNEKYFLIRQ